MRVGDSSAIIACGRKYGRPISTNFLYQQFNFMRELRDMKNHQEPFGTIIGMAPGNVPVYSSDYSSIDKNDLSERHTFRSYYDGVFMGYKWQCVEFARRWLYINKGFIFNDIAMAYDIFQLTTVRKISNSEILPFYSFSNGSLRAPIPGALLIWDEGGEFEDTGHVAVVTEVFDDKIRIVEQNERHSLWNKEQNYSRELKTKIDDNGGHWIECSYHDASLLGWVIQTDDSSHSEKIGCPDKKLFKLKKRELENKGQAEKSWLNIANADEAAYVESYGPKVSDKKGSPYQYYCISESAMKEVKHATNELHAMFMQATDYVLRNEKLLEKFCLPPELWNRIHRSWNNRRNEMITGRFDFAVTEMGLKVYEYNADSASCYMETGKIQKKWAKHFGCSEGRCAGDKLHSKLIEAWKDSDVEGILHIMLDDDPEENYHAKFMQTAIEEAGIECRVLKGVENLHWAKSGEVVDSEGIPVRWVWKTWAWETALDEIRQNKSNQKNPRLADVLFGNDVLVYEPLWTLIPSNKAILPILWDLYPNHPNLLSSSFDLTDDLRKTGYVTKPIVGRCGANISLVDADDSVLHKTGGRFEEKDQIYQELFGLQKIEGDHIQLQSFSVSGVYAGAGVRIDPSPIVVSGSDLPALRIIDDQQF